ncbi:SDR family NAD(P)-dependent oxidoreductase [Bordetella trematum]|uniref:SDR family NAD(P)-dependent oxidoreductase n=1 Tax=Bordetella trematum TaxID=123899 RepID=UPI0015C5822B|nr:SDR family NAD(P)-dependent oxidoreductase [Bordetella trematum]
MHIMIIGASKGLGRALFEGLGRPGDTLTGVVRRPPVALAMPDGVAQHWIRADLSQPATAADAIAQAAPAVIDTLIYNLGIWETHAFSRAYDFLTEPDAALTGLVDVNISAALLLLKRLLPRVLRAKRPQLVLTGSTSGLRGAGRPEVAFGASKFALNGMAEALREGYREAGLAVSVLQLGYLNTDDALAVPREQAAARGEGGLVPVHDVVAVVDTLIRLSGASFVRELVMPAIADTHF